MSFIKDFKAFALKGNVIDMAVGVIVGGAFGKIVTSLVNDIIMPFITIITGNGGFENMKYVIKEATAAAPGVAAAEEVAVNYGAFIMNVVDFFIIALSIFVALRCTVNLIKKEKKEEEAAPAAPAAPTTEELLTEIRDLLAQKEGASK